LLALASKEIDYNHFKTLNNKDLERQYSESLLNFVGFFICSSPLKEDTVKNIVHLR
jgi:magnesium-transporting ATPase (P-type)